MTAVYIQDETELNSLLETEALFVVDCTAVWCGPCKLIAPLIDKLALEYSNRVKIFKLDLDANQSVVKRFGIRSIPSVMFFQQGSLAETIMGVKTYEEFSNTLNMYLA